MPFQLELPRKLLCTRSRTQEATKPSGCRAGRQCSPVRAAGRAQAALHVFCSEPLTHLTENPASHGKSRAVAMNTATNMKLCPSKNFRLNYKFVFIMTDENKQMKYA